MARLKEHDSAGRGIRRVAVPLGAAAGLALAGAAAAAGPVAAAEDGGKLDPQELVHRIETQYRGETSHAIATMEVVTDAWTRELKMEMWSKGRDRFLVRILEPTKEEGVTTLKAGDEVWNYLPKIDRLMKVPSSMMGEGWMGSHITNDDLVKEDKVDQLYTFEVRSQGPTTAVIEATPKPDAAVVWGEIVYVADHEKMVPRKVDYFDEDGVKVRTMRFDDVREVSGRHIPFQMTVQPVEDPAERTVITYETLEFGVPLDDGKFSVRNLRRR